ncbi:beta-1,3-galactosyltransferase 2-like [Gadus chalcogrammus]|uniref:beta-1,3-galactosyltransferase 2-like n=1 Tax=Gadus chalcogrammus TaxID=1042646 RepID=UPI0024C49E65|nr:beta-1,3-galactosyltransferase 2-like [Gadus chalcogrammus]
MVEDPNLYSVSSPQQHCFILDEPEYCLQKKPFLVIMITVAPHNRVARNAIRDTWAGETTVLGKRVSHFFLLGQSEDQDNNLQDQLLRESVEHRDLLQGDFVDTYHNLTIKTMLMLQWLDSRCPGASYAMKTDSDTFINVRSLMKELYRTPRHGYMTGNVVRKAHVHRDPNSKWFMPDNEYFESMYPPYALGLCYVFSMDLPGKLVVASWQVKAVWLEDVYLGMCMRYLGVDLTDPPAHSLFLTSKMFLLLEAPWNRIIAAELESPQQLLDVWRNYKMGN